MDEAFAMVKDVTVTRCDRLLALVGCGLDVNARCGPKENTLLLNEACCGNKRYVKPLLENGANPSTKDRFGSTAAYFAVGHLPTLQQLAAAGADLNTWPHTLLGLIMSRAWRARRYLAPADRDTIAWLLGQPHLDLEAFDCHGESARWVAHKFGFLDVEAAIDRERAAHKRWSLLRAGWVTAIVGRH
jgi:ankyrin repeat protein